MMRTVEEIERANNLVLCASNEGYEIDLKVGRFYSHLPDESLEPDDLRVVDETGEDYIYPADYFVSAADIERSSERLSSII